MLSCVSGSTSSKDAVINVCACEVSACVRIARCFGLNFRNVCVCVCVCVCKRERERERERIISHHMHPCTCHNTCNAGFVVTGEDFSIRLFLNALPPQYLSPCACESLEFYCTSVSLSLCLLSLTPPPLPSLLPSLPPSIPLSLSLPLHSLSTLSPLSRTRSLSLSLSLSL